MGVLVVRREDWRRPAQLLGVEPELAADETLSTNAGRVKDRDRVVRELAKRVRKKPALHWIDRLKAAGVPCGLVRTVSEALEGTTADARTGVAPSVPGSVRLPPPKLDEHGDSIRALAWRAFQ